MHGGQPVAVIGFLVPWCQPSRRTMGKLPRLAELHRKQEVERLRWRLFVSRLGRFFLGGV